MKFDTSCVEFAVTLQVSINNETLDTPQGLSLFECGERLGVHIPTSCHKNGKCRECLVEVAEGMEHLTSRSPEEAHLSDPFRLSCRARLVSDSGMVRCHTMRRGELRIEEASVGLPEGLDVIDAAVTRRGNTVLIDGEPIAEADGPLHGLAVDLGTTTVVVRLHDLESGALLAVQSFENPQRFGGSDVMARIRYDTDHKGRLLQRTLLGYLGRAIEEFDCDPETIYEIVLAGNSTMRDLFFGLNVYSIGQKPYQSLIEKEFDEGKRTTTSLSAEAKKFRLPVHPKARVYGLPLIRGHVGADSAACLLAAGWETEERLVALMDIGTNTELLLGNRHRLFVASCPAGPAFEGGVVSRGMPALEGAIEAVRIADDGSVSTQLIGNPPPEGICGSGLVELLSELRRTGRMNDLGRLADDQDRFVVDTEHDIALTEADISELAQAKAANVSGLRIILKRYGVDLDDIDVFYLAGGFAKNLELNAARRIGLIPNLPDEKIVQVGNASIAGASVALLSSSRRARLEEFVTNVTHVELETDEHFFDHFVEGCRFVPVETEPSE